MPVPKKQPSVKRARKTKPATTKPKLIAKTTTTPTKAILPETENLKLKVKQLRADLKKATVDNEQLQKEIATLHRKNASLGRKLPVEPTPAKAKAPTKKVTKEKPKSVKRKTSTTDKHWVDKWWESF